MASTGQANEDWSGRWMKQEVRQEIQLNLVQYLALDD